MTAYQLEKYRRHLQTDPLYIVAHEQIKHRLKRKSWQISTDVTFKSLNINSSKKTKLNTTLSNQNNITLHNRLPLNFVSKLPPWTIINDNVKIIWKLL